MLWHFFFDTLACVVAFRIYLWSRNHNGDSLETGTRRDVIVAAIAGAAIGSRLLFWLEDPSETQSSSITGTFSRDHHAVLSMPGDSM